MEYWILIQYNLIIPALVICTKGRLRENCDNEQNRKVYLIEFTCNVEIKIFALIDTGSQVTLIKDKIAKKSRLLWPAETASIGTIHGKDPPFRTQKKGIIINRRSLTYGY